MGKRETLYRKYRSASLDEIIGQDHVVEVLRANLASGKHAQAYLLTGPRGVGKTSIARILAYELNKLPYGGDHLDIIEIDAASNGSVDDARELRDKASISPSALTYKVYIIDEVHMLSRQAFDALLKLLEEPPSHAVFIMATTEVDKVPATIKSRAEQYHFHLVPTEIIAGHLRTIAQKEGLKFEDQALTLLAELGQGSLRDAISLLDQMSGDNITAAGVARTFGLPARQQIQNIFQAMAERDSARLVAILDELTANGVHSASLTNALIRTAQAQVATEPAFFELIERLLDVPKSANPDLKLLAILGNWSAPLGVRQADEVLLTEPEKPPVTEAKPVKKQLHTEKPPAKSAPTNKKSTETPPVKNQPEKPKPEPAAKIVWADIVREIKKNNPLFGNSLQRARHDLIGDKLTIYFSSATSQKAANTPGHRKLVSDTIKEGYGIKVKIDIAETLDRPAQPLKVQEPTSKYAAISDIMGGGVIM